MKKIKINDFLFFLGYSLVIFSDMFSAVKGLTQFIDYIDYIGLGILFVLILLRARNQKYSYRKILIMLVIFCVLVSVRMYSGDNLLLKIFIITLAFRNIDLKRYIKYDLILRIIYLSVVIILYKMGLTSNYILYRSDGLIRSSLGFSHPNNFGQYVLIICCDFIFLRFDKLKIVDFIIPIIGFIVIDYFSNSRTSCWCLVLLMLLMVIKKVNSNIFKKKIIKKIFVNIFLVASLLGFLMVYGYNAHNSLALKLNDVLSNRLQYASDFIEKYDITLFGNEVKMLYTQDARMAGKQPWVLDNSYLVCILRYGIIAYVLIYIVTRKALIKFYDSKRYDIIIMWIIFSINGMFENYLFKIHFNPYLTIISYLLYDDFGKSLRYKNKEGAIYDGENENVSQKELYI